MDGEWTVAEGVETRDWAPRDGTWVGRGMSFSTVSPYCVTLWLEKAVLMSSTVMIKSICTSSSDGYGASMWTVVQGLKIIPRRCPWVR